MQDARRFCLTRSPTLVDAAIRAHADGARHWERDGPDTRVPEGREESPSRGSLGRGEDHRVHAVPAHQEAHLVHACGM